MPGRLAQSDKISAADCAPASHSINLEINNVRALIQNGGDLWWDLDNNAKYEVPKHQQGQPENPSSMFAGAVWVGGFDAQGQLKVAAQTYRQNGNDFFPGPLNDDGTVDKATCRLWDTHFQVFGSEIDSFLNVILKSNPIPLSPSQVPDDILKWPGNGNPYNANVGNRNMAPFYDVDNNGYYDPTYGDYPIIDQTCSKATYADQMIWWVYNDKGNIHTETGATAIGLEVHALAFGFKTNDEVNNMTFYKYQLLNKATSPLDSAFMGQWLDPDLGCYVDDYVGCNVETGLGIIYNGEAVDGGSVCALSYGRQPPYLGIDYFRGPLNQYGVELGMSSFLYYNNDFTLQGNPENAGDYYGYLSGTWKDGTPFIYGGDAYCHGSGSCVPTKFVFPDDPSGPGWSECSAKDVFADRREIEASGPFRLDPGTSNDIIVGVVWVRPPIGTYPCPNFGLLEQADKKAQALFDHCFQLLEGPPAPDLSIVELDRALVLSINNTEQIENFKISDPEIAILGVADSIYAFQGYQLYQLANSNVTAQDFSDPSKARLILQEDVKDGVSKLVNLDYDPNLDATVPTLEVEGADQGIKHTLLVTTDAFATGNTQLVNNKTYYFSLISYAYNNFVKTDSIKDTSGHVVNIVTTKQSHPYLPGRKNIKPYSGIPHKISPENGGLVLNSTYGDGPQIMRQEGTGNGELFTDLTQQSVEAILSSPSGQIFHQIYNGGAGPVGVKVYNPKIIPNADFELGLVDTSLVSSKILNGASTYWYLTNLSTGETKFSDTTINASNEQLIPDWGLSVFIKQVRNPGGPIADQTNNNNGYIGATMQFENPQEPWLAGFPDFEGPDYSNWIRSGTADPTNGLVNFTDYSGFDDNQVYENVLGGIIAPYRLTSDDNVIGPAWADVLAHSHLAQGVNNPLDSLISFDLVFTADTSKWTHCVVVETQSDLSLTEGNKGKLDLRAANSRNKDGSENPNDRGRSWFPGYAINPETGERLNIIFGENSWLTSENGRDMLWDPTSSIVSNTFTSYVLGGMQYVYITRSKYDEGANYQRLLTTGLVADKRIAYYTMAWTMIPLLANGFQLRSLQDGLIPTTTTIKVRVTKPYQKYVTDVTAGAGFPKYLFNTANIAARSGDLFTAVNALDTIRIVPNPYYAYSAYEQTKVQNVIKITNLPKVCTITIYALDGTLIKTIKRDDASITSVNWDLTNDANIPIASGLYIIHIDAPGIGEKTLKWFGVMRPTDLSNY